MEKLDLFLDSKNHFVFGIKLLVAFVLSAGINFFTIPIILKISRKKNLMAMVKERSSHIYKVSNMGGIAIFYSIAIFTPIFAYELFDEYKFLFPSMIILFYIGILDDILEVKAYHKIIAQIVVSFLMVVGSDIRIKTMFGLFGIYQIDYIVSVILSILVFIVVINSFNLIDGIDGLAGVFSMICCILFGISYFRLGEFNYPMVMLCTIISGTLLGFLYYNLSENKTKIFMGDTGSLLIGFLLVVTSFYFLDIFAEAKQGRIYYHLPSAPAIVFAILILPIIDTLNVIIVRLANKKSPLIADKNHIHHKLLNLGLTHLEATIIINFYYLFVIIIAYLFRHLEVNTLFFIILGLGCFGVYLPNVISKYKIKK